MSKSLNDFDINAELPSSFHSIEQDKYNFFMVPVEILAKKHLLHLAQFQATKHRMSHLKISTINGPEIELEENQ